MFSFHDYVVNHGMYFIGISILGSERCCEALQKLGKRYDIVVNVQGDEPLIEPEIIDGVVMALQVVTYATLSYLDVFGLLFSQIKLFLAPVVGDKVYS